MIRTWKESIRINGNYIELITFNITPNSSLSVANNAQIETSLLVELVPLPNFLLPSIFASYITRNWLPV